MKLAAIHHVAIIVSDYEKSKDFYVNKLGFEIVRENFREERNDWKLDLRVGEGADAIELEIFAEPNPPKRVNRPEACGLRHLAFRVDDVEATVAELEQMGIGCEPIRFDSYTQKKMTFFFDPDPFIAIGKITLLQGDPGDGKSTMMMNLIAELSTGGKTPDGCKIGAPQKVIYQCSEDGVSDTIKPRLERCGADCKKIAFINEEIYNGLTLDDERIRQAIIEFRPRLVVIDPIQAYLGSDSDLQIAGRARKLMRRLGMWAAGYDCAIVLIGHLNKKEGSKGLYRSLGSIDVVAAARSVLQVERDTENPDIRIVHQIKNSLAPTAEDIHFSISAEKGFQWMECRPQLIEKQQQDIELRFDSEQQKAVYWIKHFLEKGDMSANEIYCRLDNEGISKRVARMVKTEMGIHCYQKKRKWYWSVQPEEGVMNGPQV